MELKPGDIFLTVNPMMLGRAICAAQAFWAEDRSSVYSHAGIILGPNATTFEALWTNRRQGLFSAYEGRNVLIARHDDMTTDRFMDGWREVEHLEGRWYAGHRLILHLFPPLARMVGTGDFAVCSELAAKFLCGAGICQFWMGVNPDNLADRFHNYKGWTVLFEGKLPDISTFRGLGSPTDAEVKKPMYAACGLRHRHRGVPIMFPAFA